MRAEEEEKLFESGEFGCHNPEALQRTLWWFFSLHFGFQARDESRKLCRGDLELHNDPETGKSFGLDGRKREQDQERHARCSPATVQPKNIRNGNRKMPGPLL